MFREAYCFLKDLQKFFRKSQKSRKFPQKFPKNFSLNIFFAILDTLLL